MKNTQKGFINSLLLVVLAFLVIGGGTYFYVRNKPQDSLKKVAFSDFINQAGSYKCEVKSYIDRAIGDTKINGTAYISSGMVRVDYGAQFSLIHRDNKTYTWWGTENLNYKNSLMDGWVTNDSPYFSTYAWDAKQITDYDCVRWNPDLSKFDIPSSINFSPL